MFNDEIQWRPGLPEWTSRDLIGSGEGNISVLLEFVLVTLSIDTNRINKTSSFSFVKKSFKLHFIKTGMVDISKVFSQ